MSIVLDGTAGITTPEITSSGGPLVVNASAPDNSVVVNASGNVGIGTSSPATRLHVAGSTTATSQVTTQHTGSAVTTVFGCDGGIDAGAVYVTTNHPLAFRTNNTERMRIDSSGNLLVGTTGVPNGTSVYGAGFSPATDGRMTLLSATSSTSDLFHVRFFNPNGAVGSIRTSGSATSYVTSSDYRLKEDIAPMTGALAKVALLKPCTYKWKVDGSDGQGFIAHELAEVEPGCVSGEKDAVDAEGNPQYQGIDTSFLVATLTAAIQEQQAIITAQQAALESLTARVVALETQP